MINNAWNSIDIIASHNCARGFALFKCISLSMWSFPIYSCATICQQQSAALNLLFEERRTETRYEDWRPATTKEKVLDSSGRFIRMMLLRIPTALHIVDKYVYVSDDSGHCIVYETSGQFVISFGECGLEEGKFCYPHCITSCTDGFIYVCYK